MSKRTYVFYITYLHPGPRQVEFIEAISEVQAWVKMIAELGSNLRITKTIELDVKE